MVEQAAIDSGRQVELATDRDSGSGHQPASHLRVWLGYAVMILLAVAAFAAVRNWGEQSLQTRGAEAFAAAAGNVPVAVAANAGPANADADDNAASLTTAAALPSAKAAPKAPTAHVFRNVLIALVAILVAARVSGSLFVRIGQPRVIGEVIAGLVLGPSCLGRVWPEATEFLLPPAIAPLLGVLAQLGVVLYMFLVGLELNFDSIRSRGREALLVSHASIAVPFVLGAALALFLYEPLAGPGIPFTTFALFLGVAMSITALPVLARIIADRGLAGTRTGVMALACAAADDATAWCLLAVVVGLVGTQLTAAMLTWFLAALFVAGMFLFVRPLLAKWLKTDVPTAPSPAAVAMVLLGVLVASLTTDTIGIHAIFGAFLLGAIIPHDSGIAEALQGKLEDVVRVLLLPAFFALTGMRTKIGLLDGTDQWLLCGAIVLVATVGKLGGTMLAARYCGLGWRTSAELGALMNTRGLMEIIVLDLGLQLGVITPPLFAMMVVMAIATTLMTGPLLTGIQRWFGVAKREPGRIAGQPTLQLEPPASAKTAAVA